MKISGYRVDYVYFVLTGEDGQWTITQGSFKNKRVKVMHEVAAMQSIVRTILEYMQKAGASRVTNVQLELGASGHFTAEAAQQHFEVLTKGTPIEEATLKISWLAAQYQCLSCFHRFETCELATKVMCPTCGDVAIETEHQDICFVSAIDVVFDDNIVPSIVIS
jgi:hydrogenase nickel insertion protein HypA